MARDPICGTAVDASAERVLAAEYKQQRYFFCSEGCRSAFRRRVERLWAHELLRAGALFSAGRAVRPGLA